MQWLSFSVCLTVSNFTLHFLFENVTIFWRRLCSTYESTYLFTLHTTEYLLSRHSQCTWCKWSRHSASCHCQAVAYQTKPCQCDVSTTSLPFPDLHSALCATPELSASCVADWILAVSLCSRANDQYYQPIQTTHSAHDRCEPTAAAGLSHISEITPSPTQKRYPPGTWKMY